MKTTTFCNSYVFAKSKINVTTSLQALSALALSLTLTACGQGFHARSSNHFSSQDESAYLNQYFDVAAENESPQKAEAVASATDNDTDSNADDGDKEEVQERAPASAESHPELEDATQPQFALNMKAGDLSPDAQQRILARYKYVDPQHQIAPALLKKALVFYFVNQQKIPNTKVLTVVDYALPSSQKRLYVIEMSTGKVWSTFVAHGSGSDRNQDGLAEGFSNRVNSNATSLGVFLTMMPYQGQHGYSLRLKGLSQTNSNALERNVVIHGARYAHDLPTLQGRSWGCIAVAPQYSNRLINTVKGGSLIYSGVSNPERDHEF